MRKPYPSDITREQFSLILIEEELKKEDLKNAKKLPNQDVLIYTIYFAQYIPFKNRMPMESLAP